MSMTSKSQTILLLGIFPLTELNLSNSDTEGTERNVISFH